MQYISPPNKIMRVGNVTGDPQLAIQQPSNWAIFDEFDLSTGLISYDFFESVNSKNFPHTNLNSNRLAKNQSINVQRCSFAIVTYNLSSGVITGVKTIQTLDEAPASLRGLLAGVIRLTVGTTEVLPQYPILSTIGPWNKSAQFMTPGSIAGAGQDEEIPLSFYRSHVVHEFSSAPVITPDVEFKVNAKFAAYTKPAAGTFLRLTLEGFGTVQQNYGTI
jgi:hypothetical protein